jgi:GntR family transcriptional regulator, transcriptional repressor for pyruvate dehydrogenase complex
MIGTMTDDAPALRTHRRPRRLATELVSALSDQIHRRRLQPGDQLPTELKIMEEFGVSRTVVREAISGLQSAGLVETKHGIGTFVLDSPRPLAFRIAPGGIPTVRDIQAMLEFRLGLESEAAAFAAERRSESHLKELHQALSQLQTTLQAEGHGGEADFMFHLRIAEATGNHYFAEVLHHFGKSMIPRTRITVFQSEPDLQNFLKVLSREHEQILHAIERKEPRLAAKLMRTHLANSIHRFAKAQTLNGNS